MRISHVVGILLCFSMATAKKRKPHEKHHGKPHKTPSHLRKGIDNFLKQLAKEKSKPAEFALGQVKIGCDDYDWCSSYKSYCTHQTVQKYCKGTCGICTTPPPTTTTPPQQCADNHPQCSLAVKRGFCTSKQQNELEFAKMKCSKSCQFCSVQTVCKDKNPRCSSIKSYCSSVNYKSYMTKNCEATCGICDGEDEIACGVAERRKKKTSSFIVGGHVAPKGYYPWQAAIYYEDDFLCGGSLIDNKHVLTAAHCFKYLSTDLSLYKVVLGDNNRDLNEGSEKTRKVKRIVQHSLYKYESDTNDIALLELSATVRFGEWINAICLPRQNEVLPIGSKCYMSGWGKVRNDGSSVPQLQELKLPIVNRAHCKERNTFNNHVVNDKMVCGGFNNGYTYSSGCHGDSGGPLACEQSDGSWKLYGAVSWGSSQCNGLDRYTVFTRVSKYITWVENII